MSRITRRTVALSILRECDEALKKTLGPEEPRLTDYERKKAYSDAYPWGERHYHPYKAWLGAIKEHLAERAKLKAWTGR